ncbi:glycosyltransferase family A protein [Variovorax sp. J22P271]|uniref:glycosyltransferase family 2 protein n=1 Tax=Variovorax davisae TaxID=3053515 RepID=UPI002575B5DF|nr:glycosyltransferase family A protein [Variovorax sp. J22P271]MDM0034576.1 glycosyltransferase family A protein [Variovorax sp. J22P271]
MKLFELEKNITEASALKPLNVKKIFVYKEMTLAIEVEQQGCLFAFDVTEFEESFQVHLTSRNYHSSKKLQKFFSNVVKNRVLLETFACTADHSILLSLMDRTLKSMKTHYPYRVSVVVPVYNRTGLMYKCIESLLAQTMAKEDFEILFVDDHSSIDVKGYINKTVGALDPGGTLNYRVLRRPMNSGGAGTPRNDGLIAAKGEFTFFLDSDDFVYPYCLDEAVIFGSINTSDITYLKLSGSERNYGTRPFKNGNVAHAKLREDHLLRSMHCFKLFRTSFLIDNRIFFPPGIKIGEDRLFMLHAISLAKGVSILGTKPYIHMTSHAASNSPRARNA